MPPLHTHHVGVGASPGRATGVVHIVREASLQLGFPQNAILVTRIFHPHLAPLLLRASGIVVEEGSVLQHATTLAREFGIPAIVGVFGAVTAFRNGDEIDMDGSTGVITVRESHP